MRVEVFIANPPVEPAFWMPVFYARQDSSYIPYYPEGFRLLRLDEAITYNLPNLPMIYRGITYRSDRSIFGLQDIGPPDFSITPGIYGHEWKTNKLVPVTSVPGKVVRATQYWATIARSRTSDGLEAEMEGYGGSDRWRLIMRTNTSAAVLERLSETLF